MNKIVTAAEANRSFSKLLKEIRKGHQVEVTSHGEVVARIVPAESRNDRLRRDKAWKALLKRLEKQPVMNSGPWSREEAYDEAL
jgi:prevent-host-death family protein